jgi:hypothetical protein
VANPIRWHRDLAPVQWVVDALGAGTLVTGWVPSGYEAYARVFHASDFQSRGSLPLAGRRALVELLREETATPERCWFCFADRHHVLDDQGVAERVAVPRGGYPQLVTGGPLELALAPPPEKPLRLALPAGDDPAKLLKAMAEQLRSHLGGSAAFFFGIDAGATPTRADVEERARKLTTESRFLGDVSPSFWWPEDRRWFVATPGHMSTTYVGGSRRLVDRLLLADGRLEAFPAEASDDHGPAERHEKEQEYGPVIATGSDGGRPWSLRGRIGSDGVWSSLDGGGGGGGMLPFQRTETGLETRYFGSLGASCRGEQVHDARVRMVGQLPVADRATLRCSVNGVVAPAVATVEARLEDGSVIPARLVDVGDERATFFVAVWSGAPCIAVVARDSGGAELETKAFGSWPG